MADNPYRLTRENDVTLLEEEAPGNYRIQGPGMTCISAVLWRDYDAERISCALALAFEAGKKARSEELRRLLGVHDVR